MRQHPSSLLGSLQGSVQSEAVLVLLLLNLHVCFHLFDLHLLDLQLLLQLELPLLELQVLQLAPQLCLQLLQHVGLLL